MAEANGAAGKGPDKGTAKRAGKRGGELAELREARRLREEKAADAVRLQRGVVAEAEAAAEAAKARAREAWLAAETARQAQAAQLREAGAGGRGVALGELRRETERIERLDAARLLALRQAAQAQAQLLAEQAMLAQLAEAHRHCAAQTTALDELIDEHRQRAAVLDEARTEDQVEAPAPSTSFSTSARAQRARPPRS